MVFIDHVNMAVARDSISEELIVFICIKVGTKGHHSIETPM